MINATLQRLELKFILPANTSRGKLYSKPSWFIHVYKNGMTGIGECSLIPGLSPETDLNYQHKLDEIINRLNAYDIPPMSDLDNYPSIRFGLESALLDLRHATPGILFPSAFTDGSQGIPINGLIWMGNKQMVKEQISEKLKLGFRVLKLKVGSLLFEEDLDILRSLRTEYSSSDLEIRLDANGAFKVNDCLERLNRLFEFCIHSIEQPIKQGNMEAMSEICASSPIPIALDEELIGVTGFENKKMLLEKIQPKYIVIKPSLVGGFEKGAEWITICRNLNIGWWITSALESNIGLNAIAQWTYTLKSNMVQGLGTGQLFSNNIDSPLYMSGPVLYHRHINKA